MNATLWAGIAVSWEPSRVRSVPVAPPSLSRPRFRPKAYTRRSRRLFGGGLVRRARRHDVVVEADVGQDALLGEALARAPELGLVEEVAVLVVQRIAVVIVSAQVESELVELDDEAPPPLSRGHRPAAPPRQQGRRHLQWSIGMT